METRALKNPYPDYNGNPASTQSLFDSQGKVGPIDTINIINNTFLKTLELVPYALLII